MHWQFLSNNDLFSDPNVMQALLSLNPLYSNLYLCFFGPAHHVTNLKVSSWALGFC